MKKVALGILAVAMGAGLVVTQSSFKASRQNISRWGYVQSTQTFLNITGETEDDSAHPVPGTYSCKGMVNTCAGDDASTPTQLSDLSNTEAGNFTQH